MQPVVRSEIRPAICLNMIVRNEAHIVHEALDAVAPYIRSWVIVDTGSDDGTQDVIRNHMARLGIPGTLHERPWRDFAHNRTEALTLAQGRGDYIWIMDADDTVVGAPDFSRLEADVYTLNLYLEHSDDDSYIRYRRPVLFRDGLQVRYEGALHERATWDGPSVLMHLDGDYYVGCRHLGARSLDPQRNMRDTEVLLAEIERNPDDARSVFYLAQTYFSASDFVNARRWYSRRVEMGGYEEEVYYSKFRIAQSAQEFGEPWPDVQAMYLQAWEFRPTRSEPLYFIARKYRDDERYQLAYVFAKLAAGIPLPDAAIQLRGDIYAWRAKDEQAVCASWIVGKRPEAFTLWRGLLAQPDLPDEDRQRIASNRDVCVPEMLEATAPYPDARVRELVARPRSGEVTVSLVAGTDAGSVERTLNSFLNCCLDVTGVARFLVIDGGLSADDRMRLSERYGFLEFGSPGPPRAQVNTRFWLHLGEGWQFFAPEDLISRLTAVLDAEPQVFQVAINFGDAAQLTGASAPEAAVRRVPGAGRYVLTDAPAHGPAMFDTTRSELQTATLDEVLCTKST